MLTQEEVASIRKLNDARRAKPPVPLPPNTEYCLRFALQTAVDKLLGLGTVPNEAILFGKRGQCFTFGPPMKLDDDQKIRFSNDIFCASIAVKPVCIASLSEIWVASVDPTLLPTDGSMPTWDMPDGSPGNIPRPSTMPNREEGISILLEWQDTQASWFYRIVRDADGEVIGIDDQSIYSLGNAEPGWVQGKFGCLQAPDGLPDELRERVAAAILPMIRLDFDLHAPSPGSLAAVDVELDMED